MHGAGVKQSTTPAASLPLGLLDPVIHCTMNPRLSCRLVKLHLLPASLIPPAEQASVVDSSCVFTHWEVSGGAIMSATSTLGLRFCDNQL